MRPSDERKEDPLPSRARRFATTRWSEVLAAGRGESCESRRALAGLCETYWYPLYAYVRRRGYRAEEAQDLTQEFFARLLEKDSLKAADPGRGRFRSFLLASLKNFLAKQWRRAAAQKRGGGRTPISLDFKSAESRYGLEPSHELTPEKIYRRRWALTLLQQVLGRLRGEYDRRGKLPLFDQLKEHLTGQQGTVPYGQIAGRLKLTEGAVKVAAHRLRRRCRELLREEIAQTVARPQEVDEELRELFAAMSGR